MDLHFVWPTNSPGLHSQNIPQVKRLWPSSMPPAGGFSFLAWLCLLVTHLISLCSFCIPPKMVSIWGEFKDMICTVHPYKCNRCDIHRNSYSNQVSTLVWISNLCEALDFAIFGFTRPLKSRGSDSFVPVESVWPDKTRGFGVFVWSPNMRAPWFGRRSGNKHSTSVVATCWHDVGCRFFGLSKSVVHSG